MSEGVSAQVRKPDNALSVGGGPGGGQRGSGEGEGAVCVSDR